MNHIEQIETTIRKLSHSNQVTDDFFPISLTLSLPEPPTTTRNIFSIILQEQSNNWQTRHFRLKVVYSVTRVLQLEFKKNSSTFHSSLLLAHTVNYD